MNVTIISVLIFVLQVLKQEDPTNASDYMFESALTTPRS